MADIPSHIMRERGGGSGKFDNLRYTLTYNEGTFLSVSPIRPAAIYPHI